MARQASSKVSEFPPALNSPPPPSTPENEAGQVPDAAAAIVQDEVNGDRRRRMIREAAYDLYARRGYVDGFELADWLEAESELDHRTTN